MTFKKPVVIVLLINRSLAMFASALGTWIPFALIFASSYFTGQYWTRWSGHAAVRQ